MFKSLKIVLNIINRPRNVNKNYGELQLLKADANYSTIIKFLGLKRSRFILYPFDPVILSNLKFPKLQKLRKLDVYK